MPGASLWLLPPKDHKIETTLNELIDRDVPELLGLTATPQFVPHVTLVSGVDLKSLPNNVSQWLHSLQLSPDQTINVVLQEVDVGSTFTKKLFLRCVRDDEVAEGLRSLAEICWQEGLTGERTCSGLRTDRLLAEWWDPHVSLLYTSETISTSHVASVKQLLEEKHIKIGSCNKGDSVIALSGWSGGRLWLVDTSRPIDDWIPIAERII